MKPTILYRSSLSEEAEVVEMQNHFPTITSRMQIKKDDLVIGRYSVLPYYKELEEDVLFVGATMINTYRQHRYIADLNNWYADLEGLTPKTWRRLEDIDDKGPYVLKGETNSKKFLWKDLMFAENKQKAIDVFCRLLDDGMISDQNIVIRKFEPLENFLIGFNGLPISNEWRIFVLYGKVMSYGYYWSNHYEDLEIKPNENDIDWKFVDEIIERVGKNSNFYVIDIARKRDGVWTCIELNDGQMSGLSMNDPAILYKNMKEQLQCCTQSH